METYRRINKAMMCFNRSGFYHSARNCFMKPYCIECNGEHPTRDCTLYEKAEKTEEKFCINCSTKGYWAGRQGRKAIPIIKKVTPARTFAAALKHNSKDKGKEKKLKLRPRKRNLSLSWTN